MFKELIKKEVNPHTKKKKQQKNVSTRVSKESSC